MADDTARTPWSLGPRGDFVGIPYLQTYGGQRAPYDDSTAQILDLLRISGAYPGQQPTNDFSVRNGVSAPNQAGRYSFGGGGGYGGAYGLLGGGRVATPGGFGPGGGMPQPRSAGGPPPGTQIAVDGGAFTGGGGGGQGQPPPDAGIPAGGQNATPAPPPMPSLGGDPNAVAGSRPLNPMPSGQFGAGDFAGLNQQQLGQFQGWLPEQLAQLANMAGTDPAAQYALARTGSLFNTALTNRIGAQQFNQLLGHQAGMGASGDQSAQAAALMAALGNPGSNNVYSPAGLLSGGR